MSTTGRWRELFAGRKWRVAEELTGTVLQDGAQVLFERGLFEILTAQHAYESPLSTNKALRGTVLQETDATGQTDIPGSRIAIGTPAVRTARREYEAVW
jgi:hypothetical protein